jgi:hypothetical protein
MTGGRVYCLQMLLVLLIMNAIFWDITPCSLLKMGAICSPKRQLTFNGLQSVISQKAANFLSNVA